MGLHVLVRKVPVVAGRRYWMPNKLMETRCESHVLK